MLFGVNLPYEVLIAMSLGPILFIYWYIKRVIQSRPVRVIYESKDKDLNMDTVYPAFWNIKENTVTVFKSRKEKIPIKRVGGPKYLHFPPLRTEVYFRTKEGLGETIPWDTDQFKKIKTKHELGYEAKALLGGLVEDIKARAAMSIKGQMMGMLAGGGFGFAAGLIAYQLIF